jgi:hypothetical protein
VSRGAASFLAVLAAWCAASPLAAQPVGRGGGGRAGMPAAPAVAVRDVDAQARLDRSAVWVADRFTYTVRITCLHGVDILTPDLGKDKLRLDGPEVIGVDIARSDRGNGVTEYTVRYQLTTYRVDPPTQKIGDLSVRYYVKRPGQRLDDAAPAGEVLIPGTMVAVRSLLPDSQDTAMFRDARPALPRRARFALLQPVGLGLVIVSIVPAALWAAALVGRVRSRRARRSARQVHREERASIDALRAIDVATERGRREAYDEMHALVRRHLRDACGVQADGLTPAEIGPALSLRRQGAPVESIVSLLGACERARYGGPDALGSVEACRAAIDQTGEVIATLR